MTVNGNKEIQQELFKQQNRKEKEQHYEEKSICNGTDRSNGNGKHDRMWQQHNK